MRFAETGRKRRLFLAFQSNADGIEQGASVLYLPMSSSPMVKSVRFAAA